MNFTLIDNLVWCFFLINGMSIALIASCNRSQIQNWKKMNYIILTIDILFGGLVFIFYFFLQTVPPMIRPKAKEDTAEHIERKLRILDGTATPEDRAVIQCWERYKVWELGARKQHFDSMANALNVKHIDWIITSETIGYFLLLHIIFALIRYYFFFRHEKFIINDIKVELFENTKKKLEWLKNNKYKHSLCTKRKLRKQLLKMNLNVKKKCAKRIKEYRESKLQVILVILYTTQLIITFYLFSGYFL